MSDLAHQHSVMESLAAQLRNAPGVAAVSIKSGRRGVDYGTPVGSPRASWALGTGMSIEVWGEDSPFIDALLELARLVDHRDQEIDDLVEALTQANDRQLRLFELSRLNVDSLDRASTIERVLRHGLDLTDSTVAALIGPDGLTTALSADGSADAGWMVDAAQSALREGNLRKTTGTRGRYVLLAPVSVNARRQILALGRCDSVPFGTAERKVIDALAGSLGSALRLVEMHETALRQAITENEHSTAAALANAVLPKTVAAVPGINAFGACLSARSVGGDFFTTHALGTAMRFVIGDVAGKGLPAAVLMTNAITSANTVFRTNDSSDSIQLLAGIHDALETLLVSTNRFITMLVGIASVDPRRPGTVHLSLANAGHSPVVLRVGGEILHVPPATPPIGVGARPSGEPFIVELHGDDWLVTGSDGLLEQDGVNQEMFGQARLESLVHGDVSAASLADRILAAVREFGAELPRSDDQTVFALRAIGGPVVTTDPSDIDVAGLSAPAAPEAPSPDHPRILLEADLERIRDLATWLPESLRQVGGSDADELVGPIELSIHELCINITEHAYEQQGGFIDIALSRQGDEVVFEVFDSGKAFDPTAVAVPDPDFPTVRGYGLMIMRQLASRLDYQRVGDRNRWTVAFSLPATVA